MPLTDDLGRLVLDDLRAEGLTGPPGGFSGGYFEAWLSRLAEPQPDLPEWENLANQAWFARITEQVHTVLVREQQAVLAGPAPGWLLRLIAVLHRSRTTVVTFNYDLLVEAALNTAVLAGPGGWGRPLSGDATLDLPPGPPLSGAAGGVETFPLFKLHGSVDCWWVSGDATGSTIMRDSSAAVFGTGADAADGPVIRPPGRVPFIVPPASGKSRFYGNPVTRELWQRAARALGSAAAVDLVGCSLPASDLVTTGMLADRLARPGVAVRVVNPHPDVPLAALRASGVDADAFTGGVPQLADDLVTWLAALAWDELAALGGDAASLPVLAGPSPSAARVVVGVGPDARLVVEEGPDAGNATRARRDGDVPPVAVRDVAALQTSGEPLIVDAGGVLRTVVGWDLRREATGHRDTWASAVTV